MSAPEMPQEPNEIVTAELDTMTVPAETIVATNGMIRTAKNIQDVPVELRVRGGIPYEERLLRFGELRSTGTLSRRARGI